MASQIAPDILCGDLPRWALDVLRCPQDGSFLRRADPADGGSAGAALVCQGCGAAFPFTDGIAQFVGSGRRAEGLDSDLKASEMKARDQDAERYDSQSTPFRQRITLV